VEKTAKKNETRTLPRKKPGPRQKKKGFAKGKGARAETVSRQRDHSKRGGYE